MTTEWTEGVCSDGAAILRNGEMVPISDLLNYLNRAESARLEALEEAAKIADSIAKDYGQIIDDGEHRDGALSVASAIRALKDKGE
jgi:hypothetical protein